MTDGFSVVTGVFGILGTLGGIVSTVVTVRASGARRHVERAEGASALLADLASLPKGHEAGTRLTRPADENELRRELSRIVRESAASYAKQNPTPVGFDFARVLMPAYFGFFAFWSVSSFIAADHAKHAVDVASHQIAGGVFAAAALVFLVITGVLQERMAKRNEARRIAGTPGEERYFGPIVEGWHLVVGWIRARRARRRAARTAKLGHRSGDDLASR